MRLTENYKEYRFISSCLSETPKESSKLDVIQAVNFTKLKTFQYHIVRPYCIMELLYPAYS